MSSATLTTVTRPIPPPSSNGKTSGTSKTASGRKADRIDVGKKSIEPRERTSSSVSSGSSFHTRSCKLKETPGNHGNESEIQGRPEEGKSSSSRWKTAKLFSRTLSSIEVIRAMKSKQQHAPSSTSSSSSPSSSAPQSSSSPINNKPNVIVTTSGDSNISYTTMTTTSSHHKSEVKSPTKVESTEGTGNPGGGGNRTEAVTGTRGSSKAASEWKSLKNKLVSLRKKNVSSVGVLTGSNEETIPGLADEEDEDRRFRRSSNSRQSSIGSNRTSRSGSQDEGIVCKREDLIKLLSEATKVSSAKGTAGGGKIDPPSGGNSPTSGGPRKVILKTSNNTTVEVQDDTRSSSNGSKIVKKSALKKNSSVTTVTTTSSNEEGDFIETKILVPQMPKPSLKFDLSHETGSRARAKTSAGKPASIIHYRETESERTKSSSKAKGEALALIATPNESESLEMDCEQAAVDEIGPKPRKSVTPEKKKVVINEETKEIGVTEPTDEDEDDDDQLKDAGIDSKAHVAAVKWDESNVVDAMMLGDAIQAFLKGMGSSPAPSEKRVLFKRNS